MSDPASTTSFMQQCHSKGPVLSSSTRILPLNSSFSQAPTHNETLSEMNYSRIDEPTSFFEAFGPIGFPLVLAAGISFCWTVWLIVLGITPNDAANYLMDTAEFDNGSFWLIAHPDSSLMIVNTAAMTALALSYLYALLCMLLWKKMRYRVNNMGSHHVSSVVPSETTKSSSLSKRVKSAGVLWKELTGFSGRYRKRWNVFFKTGDFIVELIQLNHLMEAGFSASLCHMYAALLAMNSLSHAFFVFQPRSFSAFTEVLVDTLFDMVFAVGYPILLVCHSYYSFTMDRGRAHLYQEIFPPGSIQLQVRLQADPIETTVFRSCFDSLRALSWTDLIVKFVMNALFSFRLYRLIIVIQQQRRKTYEATSKLTNCFERQQPVPRWIGVLFTLLSIAVMTYCVRSIDTSRKLCKAYPQCVMFAYRWNPVKSCPCIALVDVDRSPKTYDEWLHPIDATETVKNLAMSGDLQVLQLMNRRLESWPNELQRCSTLQYLSLYYTGVEVIPTWAKSFHKLEILVLQGRKGDTNLVNIPSDLFQDMTLLTYLRIGVHQQLLELPSFEGLGCLESMSLAVLSSVTELPSLTPLKDLDRSELVGMTSLQELPGVTANTQLIQMVVIRAPVCCNGFLGVCNASSPICSGMSEDQCFEPHNGPSSKSLEIFSTHPAICAADQPLDRVTGALTKAEVDVCGGEMYRQCLIQRNGTTNVGMCYNNNFQVISCSTTETVIYARRQEILRNVGPPCDLVVEAWLGCTK